MLLFTMKAVIQRVLKSCVSVDGQIVSSINRGYLVLVGIHRDDSLDDLDFIVKKLLSVRLFDDETGKRWMKSVTDMKYEILCVSQFTLYHSLKGNKPDFRYSMKAEQSREFYQKFIDRLKQKYCPELVHDGVFGAMMKVDICNDGPVTIELESRRGNVQSTTESALSDTVPKTSLSVKDE